MFSTKVMPWQQKSTMHMKHVFTDTFGDVVSAFVLKYNGSNKWCNTTICHVEQISADKFAFVRRLENVVSSKPLYERIVVDRQQMELRGYTFEKKEDEAYSEHFVYSEQADKQSVNYNFYMFRDPGLKRILRYRMFRWGIASLDQIIETSKKLQQKKIETAEKLKAKKEVIKDKVALAKAKLVKTGEKHATSAAAPETTEAGA